MPEPGQLAMLIPIMVFMIPIVAILTAHQRKMAEIVHNRKGEPNEIAELRREVSELKQLIHQQAIAIDNLGSRPAAQAPVDVSARIGT